MRSQVHLDRQKLFWTIFLYVFAKTLNSCLANRNPSIIAAYLQIAFVGTVIKYTYLDSLLLTAFVVRHWIPTPQILIESQTINRNEQSFVKKIRKIIQH